MSGLEKFHTSEAWRTNFKKFLFMERKPEIVQKAVTTTESQRYSLDICEDLKNIIEQKKNQKTVHIKRNEKLNISETINEKQLETNILKAEKNVKENMSRNDDTVYEEEPLWQKTTDVSFETLENMCENTISDPNSTLFKYLNGEAEEKCNNVLVWQKTSDESFEALERMCDKTASDPNSTLFQYLHSDRKEQVLAEVKKRSAGGQIFDEQNEDCLIMKMNNCSMLDDIEAPSRLWENTICGDTILQTSPVKMVGLLRPSTIIEEAPDETENSDASSQMSFSTATKGAQSDVSSTAYETAHDLTAASNRTDFPDRGHSQELDGFNVDKILSTALAKNEKNVELEIIPFLETDSTIIESVCTGNKCEGENNFKTNDMSVDLIDLEETFGPLNVFSHYSILRDIEDKEGKNNESDKSKLEDELENNDDSYTVLDDSVIEILSDSEDDKNEYVQDIDNINCHNQQILNNIKTEMRSITNSLGINPDTFSFNETNESDKENYGETEEKSDKSIQFNDTMEEVEYMLKKGMEYMAAEAATKTSPNKSNAPIASSKNQVLKTQSSSPMKQIKTNKQASSASKAQFSTCTPLKKTPLYKGANSTSKRYDFDIRPFPKLDLFAKPLSHARTKELTSKQQKFSHIVSPIGTYMKKTAKTPLMSSISLKNKDYFNSTAILELENESRLYQPQFERDLNGGTAMGLPRLPGLTSSAKPPLPKKAYISSDLKHIVDERTAVTIPGGKKIQKYIENVMMPAVLRHDGKLKVAGGINNKLNSPTSSSSEVSASKLPLKLSDTNSTATKSTSHIPRRNASLADLSLMSGDVSMYTIMDAQKF